MTLDSFGNAQNSGLHKKSLRKPSSTEEAIKLGGIPLSTKQDPVAAAKSALIFLASLLTLGAFALANWSTSTNETDAPDVFSEAEIQAPPPAVATLAPAEGWADVTQDMRSDDGGGNDALPTSELHPPTNLGGWSESALALQNENYASN